MTAAVLSSYLKQHFNSNDGGPLVGGKLFTFAGGTSTPIVTYVDTTATTPNTNPIILNSRGECDCFVIPNVSYKFQLTDAGGNTIWTEDLITQSSLQTLFGGVDTGSSSLYILNFLSPFTTLAQFMGNPIFWIPANSNAAGASINVNGLGVVGLFNANGTPLGANQIISGQITEIVYQTNIAGTTNSGFVLMIGGSLQGSVVGTFGPETPIVSATTTDLGTVPAHNALVTGTTTITGFGSSASLLAPIYIVRFAASLTLTNSATLTLPGNANIVTQPGDSLLAEYGGSGSWRVLAYFSALGSNNNAKIKPGDTVITSSTTLTPDPDLQSNALTIGRYSYEVMLIFDSVAAGAGFKFQNGGSAVDSRGISPVIETGWVNGAADGPKQNTFYSAPISYTTVGTGADSNQVIYKGSLLCSTPGTFGIEWAQASSTASATTLRAGSYLVMNLLNTGTASGVTTRIYQTPGTFVETVPTGFNTLTIEVFGASGGGGIRAVSGSGFNGGGGGASGPYSRTTVSVTGLGGDTLNFTVGSAGIAGGSLATSTSVSSGTLSIATITCPGGPNGGDATSSAPGIGGVGPTPTGGTVVNTPGNSGGTGGNGSGGTGGTGGSGGFGIAGIFDGGNSGGKGGGTTVPAASNGGVGIVVMSYSA